ncbi:hypothetical protein EON64_08160, partial [archaeon]
MISSYLPHYLYRHKEELQSLKEKDPEFFAFLNENDEDLLHFGEANEPDGLDQDDNGDGFGETEVDDMEEEGGPSGHREPQELTLEAFEECW